MVLAVAGFTVPSFVLGLLLVLLFAVQLGWLPSGGQESWRHAILPVITLGLGGAAVLARFTRSAMLEVLGQPYIRTASAKGVPWRAVVTGHALPNAAIPTVTIIGFMIGSLIAGAVVVESVFSWPGIGRLLVVAVSNRDLETVIVGLTKMIGIGDTQNEWNLIMTTAVFALLPPVAVVVLMQKWFVKGLVDSDK
jgi:peptide/nickel transport system permease protein